MRKMREERDAMKIEVIMTSDQALIHELEGDGKKWCRTESCVYGIRGWSKSPEYSRIMFEKKMERKEFRMEDDFPFLIVRKALLHYSRIYDVVFCFLFAMDTDLGVDIRKEAIEELTRELRNERIFKAIRRNVVLKTMVCKYMKKNIPAEWLTPVMWRLIRAWGISTELIYRI